MAERTLRVGVIGAGTFAEQAHIPGIQAHPRGEVAVLCARDRERLAAMAARTGVPAIETDWRAVVARPDLDAIAIAAPDPLHAPVAIAALEAGKHVFCDKPLAMTEDEARRMVEAADRSGRVAMVAFTFRYTRALQALRRLLREGALGAPCYVSMHVHWGGIGFPDGALSWRERADQSAGGIWADGAAHLFDALAYLLAPPSAVCAQMMVAPREHGMPQPDSIDLASCLARVRLPGAAPAAGSAFADREPGTVHATLLTSRVDRPFGAGDEIQVVGSRAAASIALTRGARERAAICRAGGDWEDLPLPDDAGTDRPLALTRMMGAFVDAALQGRLGPDDPDFAAGLLAQRALEAAVRSARNGRWEEV